MSNVPPIRPLRKPTGALSKRAEILNNPVVEHGFFTRRGGVSEGTYKSLNVGFGSNDKPENIHENRKLIADHLHLQSQKIFTPYQHHSSDVVTLSSKTDLKASLKGDALVTNMSGFIIGVLTADCAPVLFADSQAKVIGAAHAGWRGALGGILNNTVHAMCALGATPSHISCAIGPCISIDNYEVGHEFKAQFLEIDRTYEQYFKKNTQTQKDHFDLKRFVKHALQKTGVSTVETLPDCTYGSESDFFSYRRNTHKSIEDYGRQISAISLNS